MEIELKYEIPDEETASHIWYDDELGAMSCKDSWSVDRYYGSYYDTQDMKLTGADVTFRLRMEGEKVVACLKWNGDRDGALHKREELNVTIGEEMPETADISVFSQSDIGKRLEELVAGEPLVPIMDVDVLRKSMRVDTGDSLLEISIDQGRVSTRNGEVPVNEVEVELYQGSEEDLVEVGEWLMEKYGLDRGTKSKFAKGLALLNEG